MEKLYPLLMAPEFSPRPWGGLDLAPLYSDRKFSEKIGEAWLTGDDCRVVNGPLAGQRLDDLCKKYGRELVGDTAREAHRFPLLIKFLFPHEKLSVQVHPDDTLANKVGQPYGKTECWYVAAATPEARVAIGLKPGVTKTDLARAIADGTAEDCLHWVQVKKGEMIYVSPGTVHTMDAGSVLLETQQQSDITYRLYDYGRPRPLHLELGLEAVRTPTDAGKVKAQAKSDAESGSRLELVRAPYFQVDKFELIEPRTFFTGESGAKAVQILTAFSGAGEVRSDSAEPVQFVRGESIVVPACLDGFSVVPKGALEMLRSIVPTGVTAEPITYI